MVCPFPQSEAASALTYGTVVTLMGLGLGTQCAVHRHQLKALDWRQRKAKLKEVVLQPLIDEVLARIGAILFDL